MNLILTTPRLYLRELTPSDYLSLCAILQDPRVMYAWEHTYTDDEVRENWLNDQLLRYKTDGHALWPVILRGTDEFIGICGIKNQTLDDKPIFELGYLFNHSHWHKGYAAEAAENCIEYAFRHGIGEVLALIRDNNTASINVAERSGMTLDGSTVKHYRGIDMPHLIYSKRKK